MSNMDELSTSLQMREMFFSVWDKRQDGVNLSLVEQQIWYVISAYSEFHYIFANPDKYMFKDTWSDDKNPFLCMGLHLGVMEQVINDSPEGIKPLYLKLCEQMKYAVKAEIAMRKVMVRFVKKTANENKPLDSRKYLLALETLLV